MKKKMLDIREHKLLFSLFIIVFIVGFYIGGIWEKRSYERHLAETIQSNIFGRFGDISKPDRLDDRSKEKEDTATLQKIMTKLDHIIKQLDILTIANNERIPSTNNSTDSSKDQIEVEPSSNLSEENNRPFDKSFRKRTEDFDKNFKERVNQFNQKFDNFFNKKTIANEK